MLAYYNFKINFYYIVTGKITIKNNNPYPVEFNINDVLNDGTVANIAQSTNVVPAEVTEGSEEGMFDVEVTYIIDEDLDYDYWLDEAHVWIGETPLPMMKNGKMTNALGQFNYDPHISSDGLEANVFIEDVQGPFWIALHSVVQWWE